MICIYLHPMTTISTTKTATKNVATVSYVHSITPSFTCGFRHHLATSRKSLQIRDIGNTQSHDVLFCAVLTFPANFMLFLYMSTIPPLIPPLRVLRLSKYGGVK